MEEFKKKKQSTEEKNHGQGADNRPRHERGPLIDENVVVKICDLGNGCWTHYHFTQKI